MIPIHLDPAHVRIGLVGNGRLALNRLKWLQALDCQPVVWSPAPSDDLAVALGTTGHRHLPTQNDLTCLDVLWIADLDPANAHALATQAREAKVIVNVEDDLPFCDFHTPALVRRGQLLVSVGTSGASPAAAGFVRRLLEAALPLAWNSVLKALSDLRTDLRAQKATPRGVVEASRTYLAAPEIVQQIAPCGRPACHLILRAQGGDQQSV